MNPAMAENRDATIKYPCILALVDLCHDGIRELLGEKTLIASNISSPICNHTQCTYIHVYVHTGIYIIYVMNTNFQNNPFCTLFVTHVEILMTSKLCM